MNLIYSLIKLTLITSSLDVLIKQSYNLVFYKFKKPEIWIVIMFFIGYSIFLIASIYQNLFNVLWWSCIFGLLLNVPFQKGEKEKHLLVLKATDLIYREMGITNGHRKYKLGLILYAIGALISWLYYFTESVGSNI